MSPRRLRTRNDGVLDLLQPFVVTTLPNRGALDTRPLGLATRWFLDPCRADNGPFFTLLQNLDALTFGPEGMPMDKWVFYNCAELPGFIYGFALDAAALTAHERALMGVGDAYTGPVPFSMYIAMPMHEPGAWFGHNLASLNRTFPDRQLSGLGTITKALALAAFGVEHFYGATQWHSKALFIHAAFGPLDLMTAYTPAHSVPETLTYHFRVSEAGLRYAAGDRTISPAPHEPLQPDLLLDADDVAQMRVLQAEIEAGARLRLCGRPVREAHRVVHPIARLSPP